MITSRENILSSLHRSKGQLSQFGVASIGLFGSYIRNEQTDSSDIDLLIDFLPGQNSFDNFMGAYDILETLFSNHKVEVVTRNGLSRHIGPKILSEVLYA